MGRADRYLERVAGSQTGAERADETVPCSGGVHHSLHHFSRDPAAAEPRAIRPKGHDCLVVRYLQDGLFVLIENHDVGRVEQILGASLRRSRVEHARRLTRCEKEGKNDVGRHLEHSDRNISFVEAQAGDVCDVERTVRTFDDDDHVLATVVDRDEGLA